MVKKKKGLAYPYASRNRYIKYTMKSVTNQNTDPWWLGNNVAFGDICEWLIFVDCCCCCCCVILESDADLLSEPSSLIHEFRRPSVTLTSWLPLHKPRRKKFTYFHLFECDHTRTSVTRIAPGVVSIVSLVILTLHSKSHTLKSTFSP